MNSSDAKVTEKRMVTRIKDGSRCNIEDSVVAETPLTVMLNGDELATIVCSPYAHEELVVGFLAGEGLVRGADDIKDFFYREKQEVVWVETSLPSSQEQGNILKRNFASCCGKGRPTFYFRNDSGQIVPVRSCKVFSPEMVLDLSRQLEEGSDTFRLTGGVHSAALGGDQGIVARYEDIGRHNALDRILGHVILKNILTDDKAVVLSGRISSEMLIKAARIGVPLVISRSAPTGLAIDLAEDLGITVAGFARGDRMNLYSHPERIINEANADS
jgi:FdhD protein